MCHWSSHEYERLNAEPTRSFFQALRDLFRRTRRPQVEAAEIPVVEGKVIPLRAEAANRKAEAPQERADAA